jgi:hypothetical protein
MAYLLCHPGWVANKESPGTSRGFKWIEGENAQRVKSRQPDDSLKREARNPKRLRRAAMSPA